MQAHDLRGPLTRMMGLVQLLRDDIYGPEMTLQEIISHIYQSAEEVDGVVRDIIKNAEDVTLAPIKK